MLEHLTMKSLGQPMPTVKTAKCLQHGEYPVFAPALGIPTECPQCSIEKMQAAAQNEVAQTRRDARVKSTVYRSGIPVRFMSKTFADFKPDDDKQARVLRICMAYAEKFDERYAAGGGIVMCGNPGTGKTHLATAIGNYIMAKGRTALFVSAMAAVRRVMRTFDRDSTEKTHEAIARFIEPDLLILDEVGMQFGKSSELVLLSEIINGRYENVMPTILISNAPEDELGPYLGDRALDRMNEGGGVVLAFDWPSKRKAIKTASRDMPAWASK